MSGEPDLVLAADVGGTNCRMALFQQGVLREHRVLPSRGPGLAEVIVPFVSGRRPLAACVAVAGPTDGEHAEFTNHPWVIERTELEQALRCPVRLCNDFVAAARGVPELEAAGKVLLAGPGGPPPDGPVAVLGPGTGLGHAALLPLGGGWLVLPSEAGHTTLSIHREIDVDLWRWLSRGRRLVTVEDVLSGRGLVALNNFYCDRGVSGEHLVEAAQVQSSTSAAALAATEHFARTLGSHAGNCALAAMARGGVVLCGGMPIRLNLASDVRLRAALLEGWSTPGRMRNMLEQIDLWLVTDPMLGLRGAAALARDLRAVVRG